MSSTESGWNWKTRLRLTRALLIVKKGFSVVAPDENHDPVFDVRQQHVLLALLKRWISSTNSSVCCPSADSRSRAAVSTSRTSFTPLVTALSWRTAARCAGQQPGQRRLAGAGRAVEDHRAQPIGRQQPAQQLPFAQKVPLPDELLQRARPHPRRERLGPRRFSASPASNRDIGCCGECGHVLAPSTIWERRIVGLVEQCELL